MGTTFMPLLMGHAEVRVDTRPAQPPVRANGPVEGVWGNREVLPAFWRGARRAR
jgi:hypothetical protein